VLAINVSTCAVQNIPQNKPCIMLRKETAFPCCRAGGTGVETGKLFLWCPEYGASVNLLD